MQTYTHRMGGTPEPITLLQDDGTPYDLSDATVTIQVQSMTWQPDAPDPFHNGA